ncbi:tetratricopeptide repeat protein [uncultured Microscilla sp.]|uniref:tetratricopeptide repeat protein n=1 Tax=uncultured Microscilla sp. TaxID=432653 RepID=UPI002609C00E|nr:tetratricopeptide repeat protein [uncultured Microscilla sp.]
MESCPAEYYYQSIEKYKQRAYETSLELITQAIALDANQVAYYYHRGGVLQRLQKFDVAIQDFDKVIGWERQAAASFIVEALLAKTEMLYQQKNYDLLIATCDHLLRVCRNHWKGFFFRALGFYFTQHYYLAYQDIEMAFYLSKQPDTIRPYRGLIGFKVGKFVQAQVDFDIALKQKPEEAVLWFNRGLNLYKLNKLSEAIASFDKATQLGLKNKQLYDFRAKALQQINSLK